MEFLPRVDAMSIEELRARLNGVDLDLPSPILHRLTGEANILRAAATVNMESALLNRFMGEPRVELAPGQQAARDMGPKICQCAHAGRAAVCQLKASPPDLAPTHIPCSGHDGVFTYLIGNSRDAGHARRSPHAERARVLDGVPIGVKDNIDVAGAPSQCNSRAVSVEPRPKDAEIVSALKASGAVVVGKLAMEEFGLGGVSLDALHPPPVNPRWPGYITGGSSSGCAAAVASDLIPLAIGSDTAGSIRVPAAYCGVVGLKPTYGLIDIAGLTPLAPSLDHIGLIARTVEYAERGLIAWFESNRIDAPRGESHDGARIGVLGEFLDSPYSDSADARGAIVGLAEELSRSGFECCEVDRARVPPYEVFRACGAIILLYEAYMSLRQYVSSTPERLSLLSLRRLCLGAIIPEELYRVALRARAALRDSIDRALEQFDLLMCATVLKEPPLAGVYGRGDGPASTARAVAFNVSGHPAMAMPIAPRDGRPPISLQLVGPAWKDLVVVGMGGFIEQRVGRPQ